jgi:hypothetical protein
MAQLVLGMGMSHSTMVTLHDSLWAEWAEQDRTISALINQEGELLTFAQLAEQVGDRYTEQATPQRWQEQHAEIHRACARLTTEIEGAKLDILVIVGDDQLELFSFENIPALAIYYGEKLVSGLWSTRFHTFIRKGAPPPVFSAELWDAVARGYAMDTHHEFASAPDFARNLLENLVRQGFDVSGLGSMPAHDDIAGLGHAFGAIMTQVMPQKAVPIVPVLLNTYFPPNQPTPSRCYDLGLALRRAIEAHPSDLRVGILASGGLSHFVTDEAFDHRVLNALREGSEEQLRTLPERFLRFGSSEIRNWIAVAAATRHLKPAWDAYILVYRTAAGTGCGVAFMCWS